MSSDKITMTPWSGKLNVIGLLHRMTLVHNVTVKLHFRNGQTLVDETIKKIKESMDKGELQEGKYGFLTYLLGKKELSYKDLSIITLSLFGDGLSTVNLRPSSERHFEHLTRTCSSAVYKVCSVQVSVKLKASQRYNLHLYVN